MYAAVRSGRIPSRQFAKRKTLIPKSALLAQSYRLAGVAVNHHDDGVGEALEAVAVVLTKVSSTERPVKVPSPLVDDHHLRPISEVFDHCRCGLASRRVLQQILAL